MQQPPIVDSHVHFSASSRYEELVRCLDAAGVQQAGIVSLPDRRMVNFNPEGFDVKLRSPRRFYLFAGLDYTARFHPGVVPDAARLEDQVAQLAELGADGIKMWAGKPSFQRLLGWPLDSPAYTGVFEAAARRSLPIVLHVADPEVFWNGHNLPFGWKLGPDDTGGARYPSFAELQAQAETLLARHRATCFIFPHLMFRAGDLVAFSRFMRGNSNAWLDMSPGRYFFGDLHRQRERALEFFAEFAERILFGSDTMWFDRGHPYLPRLTEVENLEVTRLLLDFLTTDALIENPFTYTREQTPRVRGLALPPEILRPILGESFRTLMGDLPRAVNRRLIAAYSHRIETRRRAIAAQEVVH